MGGGGGGWARRGFPTTMVHLKHDKYYSGDTPFWSETLVRGAGGGGGARGGGAGC